MISYFPIVTGSLSVSGDVNITGAITASGGIAISGSIASASYAQTATSASYAAVATSATTASFANNFTVTGNLTAQTLVVQTITSSVDFVTGSTRFGTVSGNTHQFTGSVGISGSLSGIGATFGGSIDTYGGFNMVGSTSYLTINRANTASDGVIIFRDATVNKWILGARGENTNNFYLYSYGTSGHPLVINYSTGAATFSSSVSGTSIRSSAVGTFGFNTANNGEFQIYATAADGMIMAGRGSTHDMTITNKNGSDVFRIPTGTTIANFVGNVGIGSSTVESRLDVKGGVGFIVDTENNGFGGVKIDTDSDGDYNVNFRAGRGGSASGFRWYLNARPGGGGAFANGNPRMTLTGTGNLGIGTSSPSQKLQVVGGELLSSDNSGRTGWYRKSFESSVTTWANVVSFAPQSGAQYTAGFINMTASGYVNGGLGTGVVTSKWYYSITNNSISVGIVGSDITAGSAPSVRLIVSSNIIYVQVQSHNTAGTSYTSVYVEAFLGSGYIYDTSWVIS